jgi:hypothetical protein
MFSEVGRDGTTFTDLAVETQYSATVSRITKGSAPSMPSKGNTPLVNTIEDSESEEETVAPGNSPIQFSRLKEETDMTTDMNHNQSQNRRSSITPDENRRRNRNRPFRRSSRASSPSSNTTPVNRHQYSKSTPT